MDVRAKKKISSLDGMELLDFNYLISFGVVITYLMYKKRMRRWCRVSPELSGPGLRISNARRLHITSFLGTLTINATKRKNPIRFSYRFAPILGLDPSACSANPAEIEIPEPEVDLIALTPKMATLRPVPVTLPEDKVPSKKMARDIIGTFLTKEWPSVDPETLTMSYHANFTNAHCPVERLEPATGMAIEPLKVFIKFHNDSEVNIEIFKHLVPSKQEEALLCSQYARTGLGAKVYGFFKTQDGTLGRIDEFLDARTLEPEDVEGMVIRANVAKGLATFHAMRTSLEKKAVEPYYEAVTSGLKKYYKMDKLKALGEEGGVSVQNLVDYDFGARLMRVVDQLNSIGGKTGWCIHDVQFMNVMVNKGPKAGESKVVLIDFEFVMRNYRAFDIGGHFMQKIFKWFDPESKIANCKKYTEEEKKHFCEEYATQWNKLTGDSDTGEQVFLESEYGYMLAITFDIHNMLWAMNEEDDKDPLNLQGLNKLFNEFVDQYAKLKLENP